jgi:CRISPR-associated protein Cas2
VKRRRNQRVRAGRLPDLDDHAAWDRHHHAHLDKERPEFSAYRGMWVFAMFDLPVTDKEARKQYTRFRTRLLIRGFTMLQFSVYARHCASEAFADGVREDIEAVLPPDGQVRLLSVTDRQFGKMEVFFGKKRRPTEDPPAQFMLF